MCLVESGIPPIEHVIAKRRYKFLKSKLEENNPDYPFIIAHRLVSENNGPVYQFIRRSLEYNPDINPFSNLVSLLRERGRDVTKFNTYTTELNRSMSIHPVYTTVKFIPDYQRVSFSRVRLMSHSLKIEIGRWSRIPRERRVCRCDNNHVQTEAHVLINCVLTQNIRLRYPLLSFSDIDTLLNEVTHLSLLCKYVHEIVDFYT